MLSIDLSQTRSAYSGWPASFCETSMMLHWIWLCWFSGSWLPADKYTCARFYLLLFISSW
jgi:hypothetical protein